MLSRRNLIKAMSSMGILSQGVLLTPEAKANTNAHKFIYIHAGGGLDQTLFMDPKGKDQKHRNADGKNDKFSNSPINIYDKSQIINKGTLRFAPVIDEGDAEYKKAYTQFINQHHSKLCVVNGIDFETGNHSTGMKYSYSGYLGDRKYPTLASLFAASEMDNYGLPYIATSGYRYTDSLLAPAPLGAKGLLYTRNVAKHYLGNDQVLDIIQQAKNASLEKQIDAAQSYERVHLLNLFSQQAKQSVLFKSLIDTNDDLKSRNFPEFQTVNGKTKYEDIISAVSALSIGMARSISLSVGGFDSHGDNDIKQSKAIGNLCGTLNALIKALEYFNLYDQTTIMVGSDYGRKPWYNKGEGKDHWQIGSMMFLGKGIRAGQVLGQTDTGTNVLEPVKINPSSMKADQSGSFLTCGDVHAQLRNMLNLESMYRQAYPLKNNHERSSFSLFG